MVKLREFLEELDRAESGSGSPRFNWRTVDRSFLGTSVLVAPDPIPTGEAARSAARILNRAAQGISMLYMRPVSPPGFTKLSLRYLMSMAEVVDLPGVARLVFFAGGRTAVISRAARITLEMLLDAVGPAGKALADTG